MKMETNKTVFPKYQIGPPLNYLFCGTFLNTNNLHNTKHKQFYPYKWIFSLLQKSRFLSYQAMYINNEREKQDKKNSWDKHK